MARHILAWEVVALAAASSPPALSESSESHVRSCRATRDRVGPSAAGRPRRGGPPAVIMISESHPSGESGNTGRRRPGGSLPGCCRRGAGAGLCCRPEPAGPSITKGRVGVGSKNKIYAIHERVKVPGVESDIRRFGQVYIPWSLWPEHSTSFTPGLVHFYASCHVATCLFDPALRLFMLSAQLPVTLPSSKSAFSVV